MSSTVYDYAIVGAGAAGLQLVMEMISHPFFTDKQILIIDKSDKSENDRTWCFWEKGKGKWDGIIYSSWDKTSFYTPDELLQLDLFPYTYKMLRGVDFYSYTREKLLAAPNVTWQTDEVSGVSGDDPVRIAAGTEYFAHMVFDSRVHPDFYKENDKSVRLLQHFKGWVVETGKDVFDPDRFVMMDFRLRWKDTTSFTYILPFSPRKALVEFTLFSPELLKDAEYDEMLRTYISKYLELDSFEITDTEYGVIPMSDFPFHRASEPNHVRIGTAGSWVKPSSGYSFRNSGRNAEVVVRNIAAGKPALKGIGAGRFGLYDSIFLNVLYHQNELGAGIFSDMYKKNPPDRILSFLDETSNIGQELRIISSFNSAPFMKALFRHIFK